MRVKIGKTWFEPKIGAPIMVVFNERDKALVSARFNVHVSKYAVFDEDEPMDVPAREEWMLDEGTVSAHVPS